MPQKLTRSFVYCAAASTLLLLGTAVACSDEGKASSVYASGGNQGGGAGGDAGASGGDPGGASGASGVNGASGASAGGSAGIGIDIDGSGGSGPRGDGGLEVCDIATLGQIGPWSNGGNIFSTWLNSRSPTGAVALDDQVLTPDLIRPYQVIVSLHVATEAVGNNDRTAAAHHAFGQEEVDAVKAWIEAGGGFMTTIGYSGNEELEVVNVNKLLNPVGLGYSPTKRDLQGYVERWDPHPVTQGVLKIRTDNGVEPEGTTGTTIAWGADNRVALQVAEVASGRVAVWGDEWITYDSEWQNIADQQVEQLWLNMLKWLSPPNKCQVPIPPPR
jgi:hypothetical protein